MVARAGLGLCAALALASMPTSVPQLSTPITSDDAFLSGLGADGRTFRERTAKEVEEQVFAHDHSGWKERSDCEVQVDLLWTKELGASIYSSPVITDLFSDGKFEVVASTFVRYLDVLEGEDGDHLPGWPFPLEHAHFHSSPLLWDADADGVDDLLYSTFNGELIVLQEDGTPMHGHTYQLPPLRVRRDWYEGLDESNLRRRQLQSSAQGSVHEDRVSDAGRRNASLSIHPEDGWATEALDSGDDKLELTTGKVKVPRFGVYEDDDEEDVEVRPNSAQKALMGTDEYYASWDVFGLLKRDDDEFDHPHDDPISLHREGQDAQATFLDGVDHVLVDPHVLSTPVLVDVDGDGGQELVCAVSYYFDKQFYADNDVPSPTDEDIDMSKYVGGGVVALSLEDGPRKSVLWQVHLDLTTEATVSEYAHRKM